MIHRKLRTEKQFSLGLLLLLAIFFWLLLLPILSLGQDRYVLSSHHHRFTSRGYSGYYPSYSTYNSRIDTYMVLAVEGLVALFVRLFLGLLLSEWIWTRIEQLLLSPFEIYLAHYYHLYWVLILSSFVLSCQHFYFFYIPALFSFRWITPPIWDLQFLVGSLGFLLVPVLFYSICSFFFFTNNEIGFESWKSRHTPPRVMEKQNLLDPESSSSEETSSVTAVRVEPPPSTKETVSSETSDSDDAGL